MEFANIILRIRNLASSPEKEWDNIASEETTTRKLINEYAMPLIIILSISKFLGFVRFGLDISFTGVLVGMISFASTYAGIYLTALAVVEIAPTFMSNNDKTLAFKLIVYSATPIFVALIIANIHPSLFFIKILYIYSIYLAWLGVDRLMKTPEKNKLSFVFLIMIMLFGIIEALSKILTVILPVTKAVVG